MEKARFGYGFVAAAALLLGGCFAGGATAQGMTVKAAEIPGPASPDAAKAVSVSDVSGGQETDPLQLSQIANADFKKALVSSLRAAGLLSETGRPRYVVSAELIGMQQPVFGFNMRVTSRIRYTLKDAKTDAVILVEEIVAPYTATVSDSMVGVQRLRLANEGSARKSIAALIQKLNAATASKANAPSTPLAPLAMGATHSL